MTEAKGQHANGRSAMHGSAQAESAQRLLADQREPVRRGWFGWRKAG